MNNHVYQILVSLSILLLLISSSTYADIICSSCGTSNPDHYNFCDHCGTTLKAINLLWKYKTGSGVFSSPAVVDGRVYVGSNDGYIYCLSADSGDLIWKYETGSYVPSSPTVSGGRVYVGSDDNYIYCLVER